MAMRAARFDETPLVAKCREILAPLQGGKEVTIATPSPKAVLEAIRLLATEAKVMGTTGLAIAEVSKPEAHVVRELSNWAHQLGNHRPNTVLKGEMFDRFCVQYAELCTRWGFEPKLVKGQYYGGSGPLIVTPPIHIPMPPCYPKPTLECGSLKIVLTINTGNSWGPEIHGSGPVGKAVRHYDAAKLHPHHMLPTICTGGWATPLNTHANEGNLAAYVEILISLLEMENSVKRWGVNYGRNFEYGAWGRCGYCGQAWTDVQGTLRRAGAGNGCRRCGSAVTCNQCVKILPAPAIYQLSDKECVDCTLARYNPEKVTADVWWAKYPPPPMEPACGACGTVAAARPRRPVIVEDSKMWVCTHCKVSDKPLTLATYYEVGGY